MDNYIKYYQYKKCNFCISGKAEIYNKKENTNKRENCPVCDGSGRITVIVNQIEY